MLKRRRLSDLYIVGREVTFNDKEGAEPVPVWLQKMNANEAETATRQAGAARARILVSARDRESEIWLDTFNSVIDFSRETLVDIALSEDYARIQQETHAEVASEKEWTEKQYLQGLRDAWFGDADSGGLKVIYEAGDESHIDYPEASRVVGELQRFDQSVQKQIDEARESLQRDYANKDESWLQDKAVDRTIGMRADQAFIQEFRRTEIFFGTREVEPEDHKVCYFAARKEVDELASTLLNQLIEHYSTLTVEVSEGKVSPPTTDSSPPSEQQGVEETADSSGPVVVNP